MTASAFADPGALSDTEEDNAVGEIALSERGPAPVEVVAGFGFWIFLLSDFVMFSGFFAAYAVLAGATAGGPSGRDLFDQKRVLIETGCLLASSFTCGMMTLSADQKSRFLTFAFALLTAALGVAFLVLEFDEFAGLIARGAGPDRSAFLSSFFALVGLHGLHVTLGLLWLAVMMAQVATLGFRAEVDRRLLCFSLFWHALDIVWIALFTVVYLMGAG